MDTYNALAVAGEFNVQKMSDSIHRLMYNVFCYDPVIGKPGHWLRDKKVCLPNGIHKEDYVRLTDRHICEWEWNGTNMFLSKEKTLEISNISQTKSSEQALRSLINIMGKYVVNEGEVFAILGTNEGEDGLTLELFWSINGKVDSIHVVGDELYHMNPFLEEHLWFDAREKLCLTST
ncbi:hypothetical protein SM033_00121 [Vibrio phage vB_VpaM_sm033]|nr:hypothetical protein SM033_00121 [Vibrio phage vB_VpaM_sm033]